MQPYRLLDEQFSAIDAEHSRLENENRDTPESPRCSAPSGMARHFLFPGFAISCKTIQRLSEFFIRQQDRPTN